MEKSIYDMVEKCVNCTDKALQQYLLEQIRIRVHGGCEKEKVKVKRKEIKK